MPSSSSTQPSGTAIQTAYQLYCEFGEHLQSELQDEGGKNALLHHINYKLRAHHDDPAAGHEAVQFAAKQCADLVVTYFSTFIDKGYKKALKAPWRQQIPSLEPRGDEGYSEYLADFMSKHLGPFHATQSKNVMAVSRRAAASAIKVTQEIGIGQKYLPGLAKLALYDFIFFCDNSDSMNSEDRVQALRDTLKRTAKIATLLSDDGIKIRLLDFHTDSNGWFDRVKTPAEVTQRMDTVTYPGPYSFGTPLGTQVDAKVLVPLIVQMAERRQLSKPVIVVIITDGEANNEAENTLRNNIYLCDRTLAAWGYTPATSIYIISRVGTSESARQYVESLRTDAAIGSIIYASPDDIMLKRAAFERSGNSAGYSELLVQMFLTALSERTKQPKAQSKHAGQGPIDNDDEDDEDVEEYTSGSDD